MISRQAIDLVLNPVESTVDVFESRIDGLESSEDAFELTLEHTDISPMNAMLTPRYDKPSEMTVHSIIALHIAVGRRR